MTVQKIDPATSTLQRLIEQALSPFLGQPYNAEMRRRLVEAVEKCLPAALGPVSGETQSAEPTSVRITAVGLSEAQAASVRAAGVDPTQPNRGGDAFVDIEKFRLSPMEYGVNPAKALTTAAVKLRAQTTAMMRDAARLEGLARMLQAIEEASRAAAAPGAESLIPYVGVGSEQAMILADMADALLRRYGRR